MLSRIRGKLLVLAAFLILGMAPVAYGQSGPGYVMPPGSTVQNNLFTSPASAPPTCTNCTVVTGSSNFIGAITVTATGVVPLTFGGSGFTNTPFCLFTDNTTHENVIATPSSTGMTLSGGVTSDVISWICVGH